MKDNITFLKKDLEVIDAVGIYNLTSKSLIYSDENLGSISHFESMNDSGCFDSFSFLYLETTDSIHFISSGIEVIAIIKLNPSQIENLNKVLFELRIKEFCSELNLQNK